MRAPKDAKESTPEQKATAKKIEEIEEKMASIGQEIANAAYGKKDDEKAVLVERRRILGIERKKLVYSLH